MHGWSERQRYLKRYEEAATLRDSQERMPLEHSWRLLDEMRDVAVKMGYQLDRGWFEEHQPLHARIREAMATLYQSKKGA